MSGSSLSAGFSFGFRFAAIQRSECMSGTPRSRVVGQYPIPIDPRVENPKEIRDRILEASGCVFPVEQLGTTDDCGFSPFCDDTSTTQEKALAKIRSRVEGTAAGKISSAR